MSGEVDSEEEELEGGSSKRRATLQALALGTRNANDVVEVQSFEIDPTMVGLFGHGLCVLARKLTCIPFNSWLQVEEVKRQCLIADPPVPLLAECVARGTCAPCSVATHPHVIKPANAASYGSRLGRSMRKSATSTLVFATVGRDMPLHAWITVGGGVRESFPATAARVHPTTHPMHHVHHERLPGGV